MNDLRRKKYQTICLREIIIKFYHSSPTTPKSTPSTPTTPGSKNGPLFAFTDPALAKRASTVKEQLLQWAQMKTKEYEVII